MSSRSSVRVCSLVFLAACSAVVVRPARAEAASNPRVEAISKALSAGDADLVKLYSSTMVMVADGAYPLFRPYMGHAPIQPAELAEGEKETDFTVDELAGVLRINQLLGFYLRSDQGATGRVATDAEKKQWWQGKPFEDDVIVVETKGGKYRFILEYLEGGIGWINEVKASASRGSKPSPSPELPELPDPYADLRSAYESFATTVLALRDEAPKIDSAVSLVNALNRWADANTRVVKATKEFAAKYPTFSKLTEVPSLRPFMDKMTSAISASRFVPEQFGKLARGKYRNDANVQAATAHFASTLDASGVN